MSAAGKAVAGLWTALVVAAYAARPLSCALALIWEVREPGQPYGSIDMHGFGVLGAFAIALLFAPPLLWLLVQRRPAEAPIPGLVTWRGAAVMAFVATPMLLQLTYLPTPGGAGWPVALSIAVWFAVVASVCLNRTDRGPSIHGAFDRHPRTAWTVVAIAAVSKFGPFALIALGG